MFLLFSYLGVYSQDSISYKQPISPIQPAKDTIKLYLEDTSYYIQKDIWQLMNEQKNNTGYFAHFSDTYGLEFQFKNKLPDGFYCLYNITKKQSLKIKNYKNYFVASGEFKNGMKQGAFIFFVHQEYPTKKEPFKNQKEAFKRIYFKNDTVHGKVIETIEGKVIHFGEYNLGVKDGFFYELDNIIILYKDGLVVKKTSFDW
jgi:hypothetical protein